MSLLTREISSTTRTNYTTVTLILTLTIPIQVITVVTFIKTPMEIGAVISLTG